MKVLLVSPWFPSPPYGGALIRIHETLRHLSRRHRVTLIAPVTAAGAPRDPSPLSEWCEQVVAVPVSEAAPAALGRVALGLVRGMPVIQGLHRHPALARSVRRLTEADDYDVIHVEHSFMAPYLACASPRSRARTVLSMHNIESLRFRRELETLRWGARRVALLTDRVLFGAWEERALRRFDAIATVSDAEEAWARQYAPAAAIAVVPNGVDSDYFAPQPRLSPSPTLVFTGLMNYPPNVDAVVWFCDAILPRVAARHPGVRFQIVGDKPTPEVLALARRPNVEVTGRVPDVRPYLGGCAAMVVPVRSGAGTRLKILEAMATARPVVSTSVGAEGIRATAGTDILIGDGASAFAGQVSVLLENAELRQRLGRAGRQLVEAMYDWTACLRGLDALYETVVRAPRAAPVRAVEELAS